MVEENKLPRDAFIEKVHEGAKDDKDILFLSADLGSEALDDFGKDIPDQFMHMGISEQNMIVVAAGLANEGKKTYTYAMAPFGTFRCYEQIKVNIASQDLPVSILGVGVGYGYESTGPTHYATEDIGCMRSLGNIEILSPCDTQSVVEAAKLTLDEPAFRYIRLDRKYLPDMYPEGERSFVDQGIYELKEGSDVSIITTGYMVQRAMEASEDLAEKDISAGVIDVFRLKPFNGEALKEMVEKYDKVVTLEEHFLSAGLGSIVSEAFMDYGIQKPGMRLGIRDNYHFENDLKKGREYLLDLEDINRPGIVQNVEAFVKR